MSDQKRWFKLWHSALSDDAIVSLPAALRWAWVALGAHTKVHGTGGTVVISETNAVLSAQMGVTVGNLKSVIFLLPQIEIEEGKSDNGSFTVTWKNWTKYQEDSTGYDRLKKHRQKARDNGLRGEERRGEKEGSTAIAPSASPPPPAVEIWPPELEPIRNLVTGPHALSFLAAHSRWLQDPDWWQTIHARFAAVPTTLPHLLTDAVAYIASEGYVPRTEAGIKQKLRNCLEFAAKKAERGGVRSAPPPVQYPRL